MKKYLLYLVLFAVLLIFGNGCTTEVETEVEVEKQGYWNHFLLSTPYYNFITNGIVVDDKLIISCYSRTLVFDDLKTEPSSFGGSSVIGYTFKPALSKELNATKSIMNLRQIAFRRHTEGGHSYTVINPEQFGEQFKNFRFKQVFHYRCEIGAFNSKNRFVSVLAEWDFLIGDEYNERIVYVDISPKGSQTCGIAISDFGILEIPSMPRWRKNTMQFSNIVSYNDKFYIAFRGINAGIGFGPDDPDMGIPYGGWHYLEISEDGNMREFINHLPEHIFTFFVWRGYLFAMLYHGQLIYTEDGENWTWTNFKIEGLIYTFRDIDGYLFLHNCDLIYFVEAIDGDLHNLKLYKVPTDNIKDYPISSINKFKDDLVITTDRGIFYKSFTKVINDTKKLKTNQGE